MAIRRLTVFEPGRIGFEEVEEPPLRPIDVRVRVKYCGICGTDLGIYSGNSGLVRDGLIKYPKRIGHEWSGVVEEVGADVTNVKAGDPIVSMNGTPCGECAACAAGRVFDCPNWQSVGTIGTAPGAFAETMTLPASVVYRLPDHVALDEAALTEPASIAYNGLLHFDFTGWPALVIIGTGAIGLTAVPLAKQLGAGKIILAGRKDVKLEVGCAMGADIVVNTTRENLTEAVMRETEGLGAQAVLETSGAPDCLLSGVNSTRAKGRVTSVAFYEQPLDGLNIDSLVMRGVSLQGMYGHPGVMEELLLLLGAGKLNLRPLITHVYPFHEAPEVFRRVHEKADTKIKMLIRMA